jgi:hypothetical protein
VAQDKHNSLGLLFTYTIKLKLLMRNMMQESRKVSS